VNLNTVAEIEPISIDHSRLPAQQHTDQAESSRLRRVVAGILWLRGLTHMIRIMLLEILRMGVAIIAAGRW
jgi:hypothetical protein